MERLEPVPGPGGVLMVGLPGPRLDPDTIERLRLLEPAGVILFSRNMESPAQTAELLTRVRDMLGTPLLLALDQEGGRVSRLEPWIGPTPTAAALAAAGVGASWRFGAATARVLRSLGFNVDFAPVLDLCAPDAPNGIADRSYGTDAAQVARHAGAFLEGLQQGGVAGCLKHFPGLGDTDVDSHLTLPTIRRSRARLVAEDLLPYRELAARSACVMVGHGHYPVYDPGEPLPATCSPAIVAGLLRGELGFDGLVASDDMLMGPVSALDRDGQAAVASLRAGCDLLLYCDRLERAEVAAAALSAAAGADREMGRRLAESAARVRAIAARWPLDQPDLELWATAQSAFGEFAGIA
jgi:beta-N-acetylhexosaminidase